GSVATPAARPPARWRAADVDVDAAYGRRRRGRYAHTLSQGGHPDRNRMTPAACVRRLSALVRWRSSRTAISYAALIEMGQGWRTAERGIDPQGRRRQVTARSTSILNKTALQQCSAVFVFVFVMAMPLRASTQAKGWSQAANSRNGKARRPSDQPSRRATMKNTRLPR